MSNNLGIFLNNTNSEVKYNTNIINYNNLKNNFQNIIIIDVNNKYSEKLNSYIKDDNEKSNYNIKIIKYEMDDKYLKNNFDDFEGNKIMNILNDLKYLDHNYITFINDNYICCENLIGYFVYVNNLKLEF